MKQFLSFVLAFMVTMTLSAQKTELSTTPFSLKKIDNPIVKSPTQTEVQGTMELRYCSNTMATSLGGKTAGTLEVGVYFPPELVSKYAGTELKKAVLGVANYASSNVSLFISKTVGGAREYTQSLTLVRNTWNEIELTTPYLLKEGEGLFIGIQASFAASNYPLGICTGTDYDGGYINSNGTWYSFQEAVGSYIMALYGIIEGDLPENEIILSTIEAPKYVDVTDDSFDITGVIRNDGVANVTSFDVSYSLNGGEPVTSKVQGISISSMKTYTFTLKVADQLEMASNTIDVKVYNPNGVADIESDNEASTSILGYDASNNNETRKVLLEHFTTAECPNCPAAQTRWNNVLSTRENVIWVSHHTGYYTDIYTIDESKEYLWFYNSGGTYAPASMLDRTNLDFYGADSGNSPVFFPATEAQQRNLVDYQLAFAPFVTIDVQRDYNSTTRQLSLEVYTNKIKGMTMDKNPVLNIFLIENGLVSYQSSGGNNFVHNHVIRDAITDTWGDAIAYDANGAASMEYTYTIPSTWKTENMKVVVFVSNEDETNPNNCNVYNAEELVLEGSKGSTDVTGILFTEKDFRVGTGATHQLTASVRPAYADNKKVLWYSSKTSIATVDENGLVTGVAPGETVISATTDEGEFTKSCVVVVFDATNIDKVTDKELVGYVYAKDNSLFVNINATGNVTIDLFDISGRKIQTNHASLNGKGQVTIPIRPSNSVYLLQVTTANETIVKKVVF